MTTTNQLIAEHLHKAGIDQKAEYYWHHLHNIAKGVELKLKQYCWLESKNHYDAAHTSDELLEILPSFITTKEIGCCFLYISKWTDNNYYVSYDNPKRKIPNNGMASFRNEVLADALGEMWLWWNQWKDTDSNTHQDWGFDETENNKS